MYDPRPAFDPYIIYRPDGRHGVLSYDRRYYLDHLPPAQPKRLFWCVFLHLRLMSSTAHHSFVSPSNCLSNIRPQATPPSPTSATPAHAPLAPPMRSIMRWHEYLTLSNICPLCGYSILLRSTVRYFKALILLWRSLLVPRRIAHGGQQIQANRQICQVPQQHNRDPSCPPPWRYSYD